tara:strand:- start:1411 stop:1632 length:222 start_codon:yes stop_codon:yes gene_type:complete
MDVPIFFLWNDQSIDKYAHLPDGVDYSTQHFLRERYDAAFYASAGVHVPKDSACDGAVDWGGDCVLNCAASLE